MTSSTVGPQPVKAAAGAAPEQTVVEPTSAARTLRNILAAYPGRLGMTLGLVAAENALLLAYPVLAGMVIDAILVRDLGRAVLYALFVLLFWVFSALRRAVDTRVFTRIHADLAVQVILEQRAKGQSTSTAAARTVLAREFVDFFEKHIPVIATAFASVVGAAVMLLAIERPIGLACLAALLVSVTMLPRFARRNQALHKRIHNRLEREVGLVERAGSTTLGRHYRLLSGLHIRLSDREAGAFLLVGCVAALLFALTIVQLSRSPGVSAGHIYAVMTYLWTFVGSLDEAPGLIDQIARLRDIGKRVNPDLRTPDFQERD